MSRLDDDIRGAMRASTDDEFLQTAGDEGMIQQMAATFRSRMRRWILVTWAASAAWVGVAVWAAVSFFRSEQVRDWIMYATIFVVAILATAMLKMWYMLEMNRNTHTREIKRVEMQIARLAERE